MEAGTGLTVLGSAIASKDVILKIIGPTADYLGRELEQFARKRVENLKKIFANARLKLGDAIDKPGAVPPRILKEIISEGSFCDDELACEYFGGVLASSR